MKTDEINDDSGDELKNLIYNKLEDTEEETCESCAI